MAASSSHSGRATEDRQQRLAGGDSGDLCLEVRFEWSLDRFRQVIGYRQDSIFHPLFKSVEGTAEEDWPVSPVFQQLSIESREETSQVALLVGMAGASHWSASIEASGDGYQLGFDIACLARKTPESLRSTYRVACSEITDLQDSCLISGSQFKCRLEAERGRNLAPCSLKRVEDLLSIVPADALSVPATLRWRYSVCLIPNG